MPRSEADRAAQVLVQDLATLMWAANLVTEFHTPQWPVGRARPSPTGWSSTSTPAPPATVVECCAVALWLRERLAADGLDAYAKTSGSKGLHLLRAAASRPRPSRSPRTRRSSPWRPSAALPRLVVHRMARNLRPGKVFVDYSQNAAAKTTAAPYTLRARPEPTVSAPVTWDEVEACAAPDAGLPGRRHRAAARPVRGPAGPLIDPGTGPPAPGRPVSPLAPGRPA